MEANTSFNPQDHDMIIEVNTNVKNLTSTLQAYTVNNSRTNDDHENRIRSTEAELSGIKGSQRSMRNVGTAITILLTAALVLVGLLTLVKGVK